MESDQCEKNREKEMVLVMKSDEWSGEAILSEKVTSKKEIK